MLEEKYVCKNCGYKTEDIESINRYIYSHDRKGEFRLHPLCPVCGHGLYNVGQNIVTVQ